MELKRRNKVSAEFSMASMTDIIFLLLIFFIITSSAISQSAIEVKLPQAVTTNPNLQDTTTVTISEDGQYYINDYRIEKDLLELKIVELLSNDENPAFTIRADENTKHKDFVYAMSIAEKYNYSLAIATVEE